MNLSVEISMYPLNENYKVMIKEFLEDISAASPAIEIRTSNMSTRLFGDYEQLSNALARSMKRSMEAHGKMVFVCKYLQGDARELQGYD